jgi:hypothetical protein
MVESVSFFTLFLKHFYVKVVYYIRILISKFIDSITGIFLLFMVSSWDERNNKVKKV